MNIKSLLLGSAAAMVAVSGAQAADAVVVEPEPVEYVRVCDAYGAGFFYIPGTETCLQIGGYVRSTYTHLETADDQLDTDPETVGTQGDADTDRDTRDRWRTRARLWVDARNETDWGTLRGWARLEANSTPGAAGSFSNAQFMISIDNGTSAVRVGHGDSHLSTWHGYGGTFGWGVIPGLWAGSDDGITSFNGGDHYLDYTYSMDAMAFTVGLLADGGLNGASEPDHFDHTWRHSDHLSIRLVGKILRRLRD